MAALMVTVPNTLGVFEPDIVKAAAMLHERGAFLYMDGANLNAFVGIALPGKMGVDALHINLHKTFSTPHGGGGPGAGPVAVSEALVPYLPVPFVEKIGNRFTLSSTTGPDSIGKVRGFYGNFGMLAAGAGVHPVARARRSQADGRGRRAQRELHPQGARERLPPAVRPARACTRSCSTTRCRRPSASRTSTSRNGCWTTASTRRPCRSR